MAVEKEKSPSSRPPSPALKFVAGKKASSKSSSKTTDEPPVEEQDADSNPKGSSSSNSGRSSKNKQAEDAPKTFSPRLKFHSELRLDYQDRLDGICDKRKKKRIAPWTKVDILEEAMTLWLEKNKQ